MPANTNNKDATLTYQQQLAVDYTLRLREVLSELPPFCRDFFRAIEPTTSPKTRISYAYDLRIFFKFLLEKNPQFKGQTLRDFTADVLDRLLPVDIEEYQEYLVDYLLDENFFENELADYCVFPIGYNQSIVYIKSKNPLTGDDRRFRYDTVPKCYGLMASEELEETGILKVRRSPQIGYRGSGILIGIIDTGIRLEESLFL